MAKSIIGRRAEQRLLKDVVASNRAELVALYGRRRVGKTFLVRSVAEATSCAFMEVTGTKDGVASLQRRRFREAIEQVFLDGQPVPDFSSWDDAFGYLAKVVRQRAAERPREPIVLFFDELPWLATARSGLLEALDYHWNRELSRISVVKLVVCGSAASWMLQRIVDAKGGLHNRLTRRLRLEPFTVQEANAFLKERRVHLKPMELIELYMAIGGVPYYLSLVERGRSVAEIIGSLCFDRSGPLQDEFERVFASLFDGHQTHVALLRALAKRTSGATRNELIESTSLDSGGSLNRILDELEQSGFITRIEPFGKKVKSTLFRVIDEYTLFHLTWIERAQRGVLNRSGSARWQGITQSPSYRAWTGYAFESVCLKHAREIEIALGIEKTVANVGSWRFIPKERKRRRTGVQIDLLFDRRDGVINVCELKFSHEPFVVTKEYARELAEKVQLFETYSKTRKRTILTLVTPLGLKRNAWSEDLIEQVVDSTALFSG